MVCHFAHKLSTEDVQHTIPAAQVVSVGSQQPMARYKTLKPNPPMLAGVEFTVRSWFWRYVTLHACHLHSAINFSLLVVKIEAVTHVSCGFLTRYQPHMFIGMSQWKT